MALSLRIRLIYYAKLSKPRIIWLLVLSALAGAFLAGKIIATNLIAVLIGGALASAGSMMINEGIEIDKDKVMRRTSKRPTVMGYVSKKEAIIAGSTCFGIGTVIGLIANPLTAFFIFLGGLIYVLVYTIWLKPRTALNIVIGGFAGSATAWAGYAAMTGKFTLASFLLGFLIFMWTPGHFWSLALRFKDDYTKAGIPMLPVLLPEKDAARYIAISNVLMIPFALLLYLYVGLIYLIITSIFSAILLVFSFKLLANPTGKEAWRSFKISSPYLAVILITMIILKLI